MSHRAGDRPAEEPSGRVVPARRRSPVARISATAQSSRDAGLHATARRAGSITTRPCSPHRPRRARCRRGVDHRVRLGSGEHEEPRGRAVARERFDHVDAPQAGMRITSTATSGDSSRICSSALRPSVAAASSSRSGRAVMAWERVAVERVVVGDDDGRPRMVAEHAPFYARVERVRIDVRVTRTRGSR
jgi:hypothetical protein